METLLEKEGRGGAAAAAPPPARREAAAVAPRPPFCKSCSGLNLRAEIEADFSSGLILGCSWKSSKITIVVILYISTPNK